MLITDDEEVKDEVVRHFQQQFRRRNHKFNKINDDWKRIYKEQSSIKEEWYKEVMTEITEKEWNETTSTLQKDTAPGISSIGYKLIKNINIESQKYLIDFANKIITNGNFPKKWKLGQIYLIPKNVN